MEPLPSLLYGTAWKEDKTAALVELALNSGFKGIDTANQRKHYFEQAVGQGLKATYAKGLTTRDKLFLQSKYTYPAGQDQRKPYDEQAPFALQVKQSFASSLRHLETDYLDAYILHGPYHHLDLSHEDWQVWQAMEQLYEQGHIKYLGVSNINLKQLQTLTKQAKHKVKIVQNRCFARTLWDKAIRDFCREHDIIYQAFSLLSANTREIQHTTISAIAKVLNKSKAQLIFRFAQQVGMLPLTGSCDPQHMRDNLQSDAFNLTPQQLMQIENIART